METCAFLHCPDACSLGIVDVLNHLVFDLREDVFAIFWVFGAADVCANGDEEIAMLIQVDFVYLLLVRKGDVSSTYEVAG